MSNTGGQDVNERVPLRGKRLWRHFAMSRGITQWRIQGGHRGHVPPPQDEKKKKIFNGYYRRYVTRTLRVKLAYCRVTLCVDSCQRIIAYLVYPF
jgi:hypothetical protein